MNYKVYIKGCLLSLVCVLAGCIENDIPYPVVKAEIQEIETNGFVSSAIDKEMRTAAILVDDTVDLRTLRITKLRVTDGTLIIPDSMACKDVALFPDSGFVSVDSLPSTVNTQINLLSPATFVLRIYQDYPWQISAKRNIQRKFSIKAADGSDVQVGTPIVDEENHKVIVYVSKDTDLGKLKVLEMRLGSSIAVTTPEPTTVTDFRRTRKFEVTDFGEKMEWSVSVVHYEGTGASLSVWAKRAYLTGVAKEGTNIDIQYRQKGEETWDQVFDDEITFNEDGTFSAAMRHLIPSTEYEYKAVIGSQTYDVTSFTTDEAAQLPNSGFEDWWLNPKNIWFVYAEGGDMFWDTGNTGSNLANKNVTVFDESKPHGGKRSIKLASENVIIKFAAGNLFAGEYVKTDGTDGILDFGRPFTARPTTLKGWFKYTCKPISQISDDPEDQFEDAQKGMNDQAHIYIALGDWSSPVRIQTKKKNRQLFSKSDSHIIAYQEMIVGETVGDWTEFKLKLDYRSLTRKPTYIVVVASASKYGDYFTGGDGSTLWLDDLELIYE